MSKSVTLFAFVGVLAALAGCATEPEPVEEFVIVEPEPISVEPAYTGKYK